MLALCIYVPHQEGNTRRGDREGVCVCVSACVCATETEGERQMMLSWPMAMFRLRSTGVCLLVGCLTSQQQASVSQGRTCSDNFTCCNTEIQVADPTFYLTQSQYTDTGPTSSSADPITPGAWQGSYWSANFLHWGVFRGREPDEGNRRGLGGDMPLRGLGEALEGICDRGLVEALRGDM